MCSVTAAAQLGLPVDRTAPTLARRFLRTTVCTSHGARDLYSAELLLSELLTNVVLHAAPPLRVAVECDERHLLVSVSDGSPRTPGADRTSADEDDVASDLLAGVLPESGRGLPLIDLLSDSWGVQPDPDGKAIWFQIRYGERVDSD